MEVFYIYILAKKTISMTLKETVNSKNPELKQ